MLVQLSVMVSACCGRRQVGFSGEVGGEFISGVWMITLIELASCKVK